MPIKKKGQQNATDPKATALGYLGIAIGSKNLKCLRREEVDAAFVHMFIDSAQLHDLTIPPLVKFGSKKQYQRILHESYQFLVKFIADQQAAENARKSRGNRTRPE